MGLESATELCEVKGQVPRVTLSGLCPTPITSTTSTPRLLRGVWGSTYCAQGLGGSQEDVTSVWLEHQGVTGVMGRRWLVGGRGGHLCARVWACAPGPWVVVCGYVLVCEYALACRCVRVHTPAR